MIVSLTDSVIDCSFIHEIHAKGLSQLGTHLGITSVLDAAFVCGVARTAFFYLCSAKDIIYGVMPASIHAKHKLIWMPDQYHGLAFDYIKFHSRKHFMSYLADRLRSKSRMYGLCMQRSTLDVIATVAGMVVTLRPAAAVLTLARPPQKLNRHENYAKIFVGLVVLSTMYGCVAIFLKQQVWYRGSVDRSHVSLSAVHAYCQ